MKRKNIIFVTLLVLGGLFATQSCTKVDDTTFVTKQAFTTPAATSPAVRADGTVLFTGTTVTLSWESTGDASAVWKVYFGPGKIPGLYQSDVTTTTINVPVLDGQTYYWRVETTDSRGLVTSSATNKFIAVNGTNAGITIDLGCTTDVMTAIGVELDADDVIDLRFLVLKKSDMSIVKTVDVGYANESLKDFATLADGEYVLGVDIYSTKTFGSIDAPISLDLSLHFAQLGMIDQTIDFPKVMTNSNPCSLYRTYLANVTKAGAVYTITKAVSYMTPPVVNWKGTDATYPSVVKTTASCVSKTISGLVEGWMFAWWGEVITKREVIVYTNPTPTTINIALQKHLTTTWKGAAQTPYYIQGTGTITTSGGFETWTINYDIKQGNTWIGHYVFLNSGWGTDGFVAVITNNPAKSSVQKVIRPNIPVRR